MIEHLVDVEQRRRLMEGLTINACWLSMDDYGSSVLSHALVHGSVDERCALGAALMELPMQLRQLVTRRSGRSIIERLSQLQLPGHEEVSAWLVSTSRSNGCN